MYVEQILDLTPRSVSINEYLFEEPERILI